MYLTIAETRKHLESLLDTISNGGTISDTEKAALVNAVTVFTRFSKLRVVDWTSGVEGDDGKAVPGSFSEVRTALFLPDVLDDDEFQLLMLSDEILTDPRALVTTPEKAKVFLESLGFIKKTDLKKHDTNGSEKAAQ